MVAHDLPPRPENTLTEEQQKEIEKLRALGYVAGVVKAPEVTGVTSHLEERAFAGLNLYTSGHGPEAILIDMNGTVLHRWKRGIKEMWPNHKLAKIKPESKWWARVHLFENGDILVINTNLGIAKLDRNSNIIWTYEAKAHHDMDVAPDGTIYALTRGARLVPDVSVETPILEDFVTLLNPKGRELRSFSVLEVLENSTPEVSWTQAADNLWTDSLKSRIAGHRGDIFHTNSLELLDGRIAAAAPAFAEGHLLVSMRNLEMVAVVDLKNERVVWSMVGPFGMQHDPKITGDGMMMVFDNIWRPGKSRVVVIDPRTRDVTWQYTGSPDHPFYSETRGAAQRLPNTNTLITESCTGRAFEVTQNKEIVWEYFNPHRALDDPEKTAVINELVRLPPDFPTGWIPTQKSE